jgi:hypothetical protein
MMCLWASFKKKMKKIIFFASLKSMKKGVWSGVGSGSIIQRYGSRGSGSVPKCHGSPTLQKTVSEIKKSEVRWRLARPSVTWACRQEPSAGVQQEQTLKGRKF